MSDCGPNRSRSQVARTAGRDTRVSRGTSWPSRCRTYPHTASCQKDRGRHHRDISNPPKCMIRYGTCTCRGGNPRHHRRHRCCCCSLRHHRHCYIDRSAPRRNRRAVRSARCQDAETHAVWTATSNSAPRSCAAKTGSYVRRVLAPTQATAREERVRAWMCAHIANPPKVLGERPPKTWRRARSATGSCRRRSRRRQGVSDRSGRRATDDRTEPAASQSCSRSARSSRSRPARSDRRRREK